MTASPTRVCPQCQGELTRVGKAFVCLAFDVDCDYSSDRHAPGRGSDVPLESYIRKHKISDEVTAGVFAFIRSHPWTTIAEIAGALVVDRAAVRMVLRQRSRTENGIVRKRTTPRSPYRFADESVTTEPDVEADRRATALPWKPVRRWESDEDKETP